MVLQVTQDKTLDQNASSAPHLPLWKGTIHQLAAVLESYLKQLCHFRLFIISDKSFPTQRKDYMRISFWFKAQPSIKLLRDNCSVSLKSPQYHGLQSKSAFNSTASILQLWKALTVGLGSLGEKKINLEFSMWGYKQESKAKSGSEHLNWRITPGLVSLKIPEANSIRLSVLTPQLILQSKLIHHLRWPTAMRHQKLITSHRSWMLQDWIQSHL